ncbi:MAG: CBS domain-containing protein [bacterium]
MRVKDYMTNNIVVIERDKPVSEAKRLLDENHFRHLPVVDDGKVVGIVSDRDINRTLAIAESVRTVCGVETDKDMKIEDIMTGDFLSIGGDESLRNAAKIMAERKIGCLPVVEDDRLVGIITETDIMRVFAEVAD